MILAEIPIAPGGPSAPVWVFLTTISLALIAIIPAVISARKKAIGAHDEASKAHESATQVAKNTENISNGFASGVERRLDQIIDGQRELDKVVRNHLVWHLDQEK